MVFGKVVCGEGLEFLTLHLNNFVYYLKNDQTTSDDIDRPIDLRQGECCCAKTD